MNISLIYIPLEEERNKLVCPSFPPLGIGYIAAYLKKFHYEIKVFDITDETDKWLINEIKNSDSDIIGLSTYYWNKEKNLEIAEKIKENKKDALIILGGPEASYHPEKFIHKDFIDGVIMGEGEKIFLEIAQNFKKKSIYNIKGLTTKRKIENITVIDNLKELPSPYLEKIFNTNKYHIFGFQTHRGCLYKCKYCQWSFPGKIRYYPIQQIIKELEFLSNLSNLYILQCIDADFLANKEYSFKIIEKMIKQNIKFQQINLEMNYYNFDAEIGRVMRKMGDTILVSFGLESSSEKVLNAVNKKIDLDLFKKQVKKIKEQGFLVQINLLLGLPYQNWDTINDTIAYVKKLKPDRIVVNPVCLEGKEKLGGIKDDFSKLSTFELLELQQKVIEIIKSGYS